MVDISHLKGLARNLPLGSAFRAVLLAEPDIITSSDYTIKVKVWLVLLEKVDGPAHMLGLQWRGV
jgi:hypothetical protein